MDRQEYDKLILISLAIRQAESELAEAISHLSKANKDMRELLTSCVIKQNG